MDDRPLLTATVVGLFRLWSATWRISFDNPEVLDAVLARGPAVLGFWHGEQMAMIRAHAGRGFVGLASKSRDGALLAGVIERLGYDVVRGSTSRGGAAALRQCVSLLQKGRSPALALDGPRGPYHVPHPGAVALAAWSGRPILFGVASASAAKELGSWDRFQLPLPRASIRIRYGVLEPPDSPKPSAIEGASVELGRRMAALSGTGSTRA